MPRHRDKALIEFGEAVRRLRSRKGWSQEELAEQAEIHRTYVGGIERGLRNVSLVNIVKISKALDVPLPELFAEMAGSAQG